MHIETWNITGNGFHFGQHGLGQEETALTMPSDSLFAALVARLAVQDAAAVDAFIKPYMGADPPLVLSSTFLRAGQVHFFPEPARTWQPKESSIAPKALKKVLFLSEALFRELLAGKALAELYPDALMLQDGKALVSQAEVKLLPAEIKKDAKLWVIERRPRVTLDRVTSGSSIFLTGRVAYAPGCGLWFGIRWLKESGGLKAQVAGLLAELGDAGLGAERSTGFGACQIEAGPQIELPDAPGQPWITLSRYLPRAEEMPALQDPQAAYRLAEVGGWLDSPVRRGQRRRPIHMLLEGAVLGPLAQLVPGQVIDVRPSYATDPDPVGHAVYRSGLALAVGLKGGPA